MGNRRCALELVGLRDYLKRQFCAQGLAHIERSSRALKDGPLGAYRIERVMKYENRLIGYLVHARLIPNSGSNQY